MSLPFEVILGSRGKWTANRYATRVLIVVCGLATREDMERDMKKSNKSHPPSNPIIICCSLPMCTPSMAGPLFVLPHGHPLLVPIVSLWPPFVVSHAHLQEALPILVFWSSKKNFLLRLCNCQLVIWIMGDSCSSVPWGTHLTSGP